MGGEYSEILQNIFGFFSELKPISKVNFGCQNCNLHVFRRAVIVSFGRKLRATSLEIYRRAEGFDLKDQPATQLIIAMGREPDRSEGINICSWMLSDLGTWKIDNYRYHFGMKI